MKNSVRLATATATACAFPLELRLAGTLSAGAGGECCGLF